MARSLIAHVVVVLMAALTAAPLLATEPSCSIEIRNLFGCADWTPTSTVDAINCGILRTDAFRQHLQSATPTQANAEYLELIALAERSATCFPEFQGWAWTNLLVATVEMMVADVPISPSNIQRLGVYSANPASDSLGAALDSMQFCEYVTDQPLQDTKGEEHGGDYLFARLAELLEIEGDVNLEAAASTCYGRALRVGCGPNGCSQDGRNVLEIPGRDEAIVFNHSMESPYYGFAILNSFAVAEGFQHQFNPGSTHYPPATGTTERKIYNWLATKSRQFTGWQAPGPVIVPSPDSSPVLSPNRLILGGGCLNTCTSANGCWGRPTTSWPAWASLVNATVYSDAAGCYSATAGQSAGCPTIYDSSPVSCKDYLGYPVCFAATIEEYMGSVLTQCPNPGNVTPILDGLTAKRQHTLKAKYDVYYWHWGHEAFGGSFGSQPTSLADGADQPPTAGFTWSCDGHACKFSSTSADDSGLADYCWNFGDGSPLLCGATMDNPSHTYSSALTYQVTHEVRDIWDQTASITRAVQVHDPPMQEVTLATDNFSGGTPGAVISGRSTSTGGLTWASNANAVLGSGAWATGLDGVHPVAGLSFTPSSHGNAPSIVEAQLNPEGSQWVAIGFAQHATWGWWADGQVWVFLKPSGRFRVCADGTSHCPMTSERVATVFTSGGLNHVKLAYTPSTNAVSVWINGVQELDEVAVSGYVPNIQWAGFSALTASYDHSRVDDFALKIMQ